ncbi:MAG: 4Fe-4S binding protein [Candidatus Cloacimonetes bacterium]|nr:4Fe-4S binding protein [Candidatus Cloacimonadota bacterium]
MLLLLCFVAFSVVAEEPETENKPVVWKQNCTGCGDCALFCPAKAISFRDNKAVIDTDLCIDCKICVTTCQYQAIR